MQTIVRTNDLVLISLLEALFEDEGIPCFVADTHVSALEGMIGAFPRRVMVPTDWAPQARRILREAGLGAELAPEDGHG